MSTERWIIYYLIKNLSWACDKKGQTANLSRTVNILWTTWKGGPGTKELPSVSFINAPDRKKPPMKLSFPGNPGTLVSWTEKHSYLNIQTSVNTILGYISEKERNQSSDTTHIRNFGLSNNLALGSGKYGFESWIYHIALSCVTQASLFPFSSLQCFICKMGLTHKHSLLKAHLSAPYRDNSEYPTLLQVMIIIRQFVNKNVPRENSRSLSLPLCVCLLI